MATLECLANSVQSVRPPTVTLLAPAPQLPMSPTRHHRTVCALPPARAWRAWPSPPAPQPLLWPRLFASSGRRRARARARRGALPPRLERGNRRAPVRLPTHAGCRPRADGRAPRAARARQYRCARSAPIGVEEGCVEEGSPQPGPMLRALPRCCPPYTRETTTATPTALSLVRQPSNRWPPCACGGRASSLGGGGSLE